MKLETKLVAIVNKSLEPGVAMNALSHMCVGFGAALGKEHLLLDDYHDKNENVYPNISRMPFIILRARGGEIKRTVHTAREKDIKYGVFLNTMTGGTYVEKLENTRNTKEDDLIYYGCVLFGSVDDVNDLTKKFSLWR